MAHPWSDHPAASERGYPGEWSGGGYMQSCGRSMHSGLIPPPSSAVCTSAARWPPPGLASAVNAPAAPDNVTAPAANAMVSRRLPGVVHRLAAVKPIFHLSASGASTVSSTVVVFPRGSARFGAGPDGG